MVLESRKNFRLSASLFCFRFQKSQFLTLTRGEVFGRTEGEQRPGPGE